jgi:hypothetical protein
MPPGGIVGFGLSDRRQSVVPRRTNGRDTSFAGQGPAEVTLMHATMTELGLGRGGLVRLAAQESRKQLKQNSPCLAIILKRKPVSDALEDAASERVSARPRRTDSCCLPNRVSVL